MKIQLFTMLLVVMFFLLSQNGVDADCAWFCRRISPQLACVDGRCKFTNDWGRK